MGGTEFGGQTAEGTGRDSAENIAGPYLNSVFCLFFWGLGGPGGGFGAPGGGFHDSRSGGKPPLLLRLRKPPTGAPKPPPRPPKRKKATKQETNK